MKTLAGIQPKWWGNKQFSAVGQPEPFKQKSPSERKKRRRTFNIERRGYTVVAVEDCQGLYREKDRK